MILPRRHLRHERERGGLELFAAPVRFLSRLPGDHLLEPLLEGLELAVRVGAVRAVATGFDRHAAALARVLVTHDVFSSLLLGDPVDARTNARAPASNASRSGAVISRI